MGEGSNFFNTHSEVVQNDPGVGRIGGEFHLASMTDYEKYVQSWRAEEHQKTLDSLEQQKHADKQGEVSAALTSTMHVVGEALVNLFKHAS